MIEKFKTFVFHLQLTRAVWKTLRERPSADVEVEVHQRIEGTGTLVPFCTRPLPHVCTINGPCNGLPK